jgi:hypothetical protein
MSASRAEKPLVIERILRDREGIWRQITEERGLRPLNGEMLASSVASLATFGLVLGFSNGLPQALSSMVKLPLLFLATLAICLPTLYLFNLVFGARLSMAQAVTLIMVSITVTSVLTLAFAPISLFFLITAQNYAFFKLLNVGILVLTALVGLRFLTAGMAALDSRPEPVSRVPVPPPAASEWEPDLRPPALVGTGARTVAAGAAWPAGSTEPVLTGGPAPPAGNGPAPPAGNGPAGGVPPSAGPAGGPTPAGPLPSGHERPPSMALVRIWILLFGFVGTQLAWTLRPFFGDPNAPFALFREIDGTFYSDILQTIGRLFS